MRTITVNGHLFDFLGIEPYTRLDGGKTTLRCWRKQCEHPGCEESWRFKSVGGKHSAPEEGVDYDFKIKAFNRVMCAAHYVPKQQRRGANGRATARVKDADIAELRKLAAEGVSPVALSFWFPLTPATIREIIAGRRRPVLLNV